MGNKKKKNVVLPPDLPPDIAEEEIELSDEDVEFVKSNRAYAGFLKNLDTKTINRHVIRMADVKEDELEVLYERRKKNILQKKQPAQPVTEVDPVDALPIKTLDGKLQYRTGKDFSSGVSCKEDEASMMDAADNSKEKKLARLNKAERRLKLKKIKKEAKKQLGKEDGKAIEEEKIPHADILATVEKDLSAEEVFVNKKKKLAEVGVSLLEDPDANIKSLKELLGFVNDEDDKVIKLGLLSLLAVFKDIIPGYRIRLPTEKELEMKVSKDVRKMRFYESTLLHSYKAYLLRLFALEKKPAFQHIALRCLCGLLEAVPHFNFHESILANVVMNLGSQDDGIRKVCCAAITSIFTEEGKHGGEATVEAVQLISDLVKNNECQMHPDSIEVFLSLTFDEDLKTESNKEEFNQPKKKKYKRGSEDQSKNTTNARKLNMKQLAAKTREEVKADLKAASFAPESSERRRMQSETLSAVFETYFRILKQSIGSVVDRAKCDANSLSGHGRHPLLAPCLRGLAKFSHLIDIGFMGDLMGCLKKLAGFGGYQSNLSSEANLSVSERLQCCIVAFKVMRNNLDALNVDLHDFFVHLYNLLLEHRPGRGQGEVLAEALKIMLCDGKQQDMQRAAAFVKRLATFSLCFGCAEAMAALVTLKHLLQKNSKCRNLLENDAGGGSLSGLVVKYQPDAVDPNLSGALASVLWELSLLTKHYHPAVSSMASSIGCLASANAARNPIYTSATSPQQAFADLSIERGVLDLHESSCPRSGKKRGGKSGTTRSSSYPQNDSEHVMDEDSVQAKLENQFMVLKEIGENERRRRELNKTVASINLYQEYKRQKEIWTDQIGGIHK